MKLTRILLSILAVATWCDRGWGHGNPVLIDLTGDGTRLLVTDGLSLESGFAATAFDLSEESYGDVLGNTLNWGTPGFDLIGGAVGRTVYLEVLERPDFSGWPLESRWFWYWNDDAGQVESLPGENDFSIFSENGVDELNFTEFSGPAGGDDIELEISQWGHHAVEFVLFMSNEMLNSPNAVTGVYGVFGRITSPGLEPSEPFLIALNFGMSTEQFVEGAEQINQAAGIRSDYNYDLAVDGADFLTWQRQVGNIGKMPADGSLNKVVDGADLTLWEERFGDRLELNGDVAPVPEPSAVALALMAAAAHFGRRRMKR